jgi:hypothetical protein
VQAAREVQRAPSSDTIVVRNSDASGAATDRLPASSHRFLTRNLRIV